MVGVAVRTVERGDKSARMLAISVEEGKDGGLSIKVAELSQWTYVVWGKHDWEPVLVVVIAV